MKWTVNANRVAAGRKIEISGAWIGAELLICISGGDRPHIGSTVQSVPRSSLTGDGHCSATSSVLNITGHKDEVLCRYLAELACSSLNTVVVCTGGVHVDLASKEQLLEIQKAVEEMGQEIVQRLKEQ